VSARRACWSALAWAVLGCGEPQLLGSPTSPEPPNSPVVISTPEPDPIVEQLSPLVVHHDDFARAELYSWTTAEQIDRLRESRCLLTADATSDGRTSPFHRALLAIEQDGSTPARVAALLLEHPALERRRYAWPSPFATALGLGPRRYGDRLIRIELDPRSILARFDPHAPTPFAFVDLQGRSVSVEVVFAEPERLAAIYHVQDADGLAVRYREYVVCSEAMISEWSIATPEIRARVDREIELLAALARSSLVMLPRAAAREPAASDWQTRADSTPLALWHAALAFDTARYQPSSIQLSRIGEAIGDYRSEGEPLSHRPQSEPCPR
jgi:hypothetical protein